MGHVLGHLGRILGRIFFPALHADPGSLVSPPSQLGPQPGFPPKAGCPTAEGLARARLQRIFRGRNAKTSKCGQQKSRIAWLSKGTRGALGPHRGARPEAGYTQVPTLHPNPGDPRGRAGWRDRQGAAFGVISWVRMLKFPSAESKRAVLPGSPGGPGEP